MSLTHDQVVEARNLTTKAEKGESIAHELNNIPWQTRLEYIKKIEEFNGHDVRDADNHHKHQTKLSIVHDDYGLGDVVDIKASNPDWYFNHSVYQLPENVKGFMDGPNGWSMIHNNKERADILKQQEVYNDGHIDYFHKQGKQTD